MKARKGFTLLELLAVVLVLAVLSGIMVPRVLDFQKDAKRARCKTNIGDLKKAIERYAADEQGDYPDTIDIITTGDTGDKYFPHGAPKCPFKNASDVPFPYVLKEDKEGKTIDETEHDHDAE